MELDVTTITANVVQSTTDYLVVFAPLFIVIAGIVLAFGVVDVLLSFFFGRQKEDTDVK